MLHANARALVILKMREFSPIQLTLDVRAWPSSSRYSLSSKSLTKARSSSSSFSAVNSTFGKAADAKAANIPSKRKIPIPPTNVTDGTTKPKVTRIKMITVKPKTILSIPFPLGGNDGRGCNVADTNEAAASAERRKSKKSRIITSHHQSAGDEPSTVKKLDIVLNSPFRSRRGHLRPIPT